MKVYLLYHMQPIPGQDSVANALLRVPDYIRIGIFSSFDKAVEAISHLRDREGFSRDPELIDVGGRGDLMSTGFGVVPCDIDRCYWPEGFVTLQAIGATCEADKVQLDVPPWIQQRIRDAGGRQEEQQSLQVAIDSQVAAKFDDGLRGPESANHRIQICMLATKVESR